MRPVIAVSGAFVVAALVLLVVGLATSGLTVVYASILASVVSAAFLLAGVLQLHRRRDEIHRAEAPPAGRSRRSAAPDDEDDEDEDDGAAGSARGRSDPRPGAARAPGIDPAAPLPPVGVGTATAGIVFVVAGRRPYHAADCPRLAGATPEPLEVEDARQIGYTPCPICHPDDHLADLGALLDTAHARTSAAEAPAELAHDLTPAGKPPAGSDPVLAAAAQGRYHLPGCHYLPVGATERTTREEAEARGLRPCALCGG